jgi:hypothetical protein
MRAVMRLLLDAITAVSLLVVVATTATTVETPAGSPNEQGAQGTAASPTFVYAPRPPINEPCRHTAATVNTEEPPPVSPPSPDPVVIAQRGVQRIGFTPPPPEPTSAPTPFRNPEPEPPSERPPLCAVRRKDTHCKPRPPGGASSFRRLQDFQDSKGHGLPRLHQDSKGHGLPRLHQDFKGHALQPQIGPRLPQGATGASAAYRP